MRFVRWLVFLLTIAVLIDGSSSAIVGDRSNAANVDDDDDGRFLAVVAARHPQDKSVIVNRFLAVGRRWVALLKFGHGGRLIPIDRDQFPAEFQPINEIRLSFVNQSESALICDNGNRPECFIIKLSGRPFSKIESMKPVIGDRKRPFWNAYQSIAADGQTVLTAYLNSTTAPEPSWIERQTLDKVNNRLISSGMAHDHLLQRTEPGVDPLINVYSFVHDGFAYFLRYIDRLASGRSERVWQLSRVCFEDDSAELRSRSSLTLRCSPPSANDVPTDRQPVAGYFDPEHQILYVYSTPTSGNTAVHQICAFQMEQLLADYQRMFKECYTDYSVNVWVHGGRSNTYTCKDYEEEAATDLCPASTICSPANCDISPMFYTDSYSPSTGSTSGVVDFSNLLTHADLKTTKPIAMVVTRMHTDRESPVTKQAFVLFSDGRLYMIFLRGAIKQANEKLYPPAWHSRLINTNVISPQMITDAGKDKVAVVNGTELLGLHSDCSLYSNDCQLLMTNNIGEQSRDRWTCGWCLSKEDQRGYSAKESDCQNSDQIFLRSGCPPKIDCFEPKFLRYDQTHRLIIDGHFPSEFEYNISVCNQPCQIEKLRASALVCSILLNATGSSDMNCTITVTATSKEATLTMQPSCTLEEGYFVIISNFSSAIEPTESYVVANARREQQQQMWLIISLAVALLAISTFVCGLLNCCRRWRRRKLIYDLISGPIPLSADLGNNEYVHEGHGVVLGADRRAISPVMLDSGESLWKRMSFYGDLMHLVPPQLILKSENITRGTVLGRGHFGQVHKAIYRPVETAQPVAVAVKTLHNGSHARQLLREGMIMELFDHENVLPLIGIAFCNSNMPMIVTPFMAKGDLLSYIRNEENDLNMIQLLNFGLQIAHGMQYLHKLKVIHRDLAARNCMLDHTLCVKIADFGLSRDVYESECYVSQQHDDLPIRWMAPESIKQSEYTLKSDVWSYGVVLWELTSRGEMPYSGITGVLILPYLLSEQRLAKPPYCPEQIYYLMRLCWHQRPIDRPNFYEELPDRLDFPARLKSTIQELINDDHQHILQSAIYYNAISIEAAV